MVYWKCSRFSAKNKHHVLYTQAENRHQRHANFTAKITILITETDAHAHARARVHTHTHAHTHLVSALSLFLSFFLFLSPLSQLTDEVYMLDVFSHLPKDKEREEAIELMNENTINAICCNDETAGSVQDSQATSC